MNGAARIIIAVVITAAVAGACGYFVGRRGAGEPSLTTAEPEAAATQGDEEVKPVARVTTMPLVKKPISDVVNAYGTVVAEAGEVRVLSVPFDARVTRVLVTPGERVTADTLVVQVEAAPEVLVTLQEARNAVENTSHDLQQAEARFNEHLATNQDLSQARQAAQTARLRLETLTSRGVGESRQLKADVDGLVSKVDVQEGQIVTAGTPLVELAQGSRMEVQLGLEPQDARSLEPGTVVQLTHVDGPSTQPVEGKVRLVRQRVDPASRLISVMVSLPEHSGFLLDGFASGRIARSTVDALVVPRDAALPDEGGKFIVYTVAHGHAVKHEVTLGLQTDDEVQVIADDLEPGDAVVVSGNYQLTDGMEVETPEVTTEPANEPAAHEPATTGTSTGATTDRTTETRP
jgi:membrane fusion protein (multidrug efflux system)